MPLVWCLLADMPSHPWSVVGRSFSSGKCNASAPDSNLCDVNAKYFCLPWRGGGGPFLVWDLQKKGRLPQDLPLCTGHSGTVQDLHFNPFIDECVASASDDTTAKVWKVPVGGPTQDIEKADVTLEGHYKKVIQVRWNPVAANVLATVSFDNTVKIWDAEHGKEEFSFDAHPDAIQSFDWNYNGSLYCTYCKDKQIRLVDPRNTSVASTFQGHAGSKAARVCYLGDRSMFCSIGFSKQSERQIFFWDARNSAKALSEVQIDVASGTLLPFFDADTNMLYLAGKGDTNIRYFEIEDEPPYQYFVANFVGKDPQRGLACELSRPPPCSCSCSFLSFANVPPTSCLANEASQRGRMLLLQHAHELRACRILTIS